MAAMKRIGIGISILMIAASLLYAKEPEVAVMAPGWGELNFAPPQAGTYELPVLRSAPDGRILLSDNKPASLDALYGNGKLSVLSFIYTGCDDVNGCPLSTFVLHSIKNRLRDNHEIASRLRMISLSFDPVKDTPEAMRNYGRDFQTDGVEWLFATTESEKALRPILDAYGQYVLRIENEDDGTQSNFAHLLRVYLIDEDKNIRNIYSVDFLHPDVLLADVKTLLLEDGVL